MRSVKPEFLNEYFVIEINELCSFLLNLSFQIIITTGLYRNIVFYVGKLVLQSLAFWMGMPSFDFILLGARFMSGKIRILSFILLSLFLLIIVICPLSQLTLLKDSNELYGQFYEQPQDYDILFLGNSHAPGLYAAGTFSAKKL